MVESLQIQEALPTEYAAIAEIYNIYVREGKSTSDTEEVSAEDVAAWQKSMHDRERILVMKNDEAVVGYATIRRWTDMPGYAKACETGVYLNPVLKGKGHGTFLKKHLMNVCYELGYRHLVAKIYAENDTSIQYNLRLGYEIVGTQRKIAYRDGRWIDVVILQYIFEE